MEVKVIAFGIARDILKGGKVSIQMSDQGSIRELKQKLISRYPDFEKLRTLRFAINEDYQEDDYIIRENDEVVIIPPVSGG